jgi:hypothetical protein
MRAGVARHVLFESKKQQAEEERKTRLQKQKRRELAKRMSERMDIPDRSSELERQRRLQENLEDMKRREEQYQHELGKKLDQLERSRVFLFERFRADTARSRAEEFQRTVGGTGLSPDQFRARTKDRILQFTERTRPVEFETHDVTSSSSSQPAPPVTPNAEEDEEEEGEAFADDFEEEEEEEEDDEGSDGQ